MLIGINTYTYSYSGKYEDEQILPIIADIGFKAIQFDFGRLAANSESLMSRPGWEKQIKKVRKISDDCGIVISQTHPPIYHEIEKYDSNPFYADMQARCFEATAILGAKYAVVHPQFPTNGADDINHEYVKMRNREYLNRICERAAEFRVDVAFENVKRYTENDSGDIHRYGWHYEHIIDAVDNCGVENVCICFDVGHSRVAKIDPVDAIKAFGSRIKCVHIHDTDGTSDQHRLPLMSNTKWSEALPALAGTGFSGAFMIESATAFKNLPTFEILVSTYKLAYNIAVFLINSFWIH